MVFNYAFTVRVLDPCAMPVNVAAGYKQIAGTRANLIRLHSQPDTSTNVIPRPAFNRFGCVLRFALNRIDRVLKMESKSTPASCINKSTQNSIELACDEFLEGILANFTSAGKRAPKRAPVSRLNNESAKIRKRLDFLEDEFLEKTLAEIETSSTAASPPVSEIKLPLGNNRFLCYIVHRGVTKIHVQQFKNKGGSAYRHETRCIHVRKKV